MHMPGSFTAFKQKYADNILVQEALSQGIVIDKIFASLHLSRSAPEPEDEGNSFEAVSRFLAERLDARLNRMPDNSVLQKITQQIRALGEKPSDGKTLKDICEKTIFASDSEVLIPLRWGDEHSRAGHGVYLNIKKVSDSFELILFNAGDGAESHGSAPEVGAIVPVIQ